jgi:hypothetical protein
VHGASPKNEHWPFASSRVADRYFLIAILTAVKPTDRRGGISFEQVYGCNGISSQGWRYDDSTAASAGRLALSYASSRMAVRLPN